VVGRRHFRDGRCPPEHRVPRPTSIRFRRRPEECGRFEPAIRHTIKVALAGTQVEPEVSNRDVSWRDRLVAVYRRRDPPAGN
jgi:hypothetical protein